MQHRSRVVPAVVAGVALVLTMAASAAAAPPPQVERLGYCSGDDWEPEVATSGSNVDVVITHFLGDPSCLSGESGAPQGIYIQRSTNGGSSFGPPTPVLLGTFGGVDYTRQADPSIAIDATGNVYVAFLDYGVNGGHTDVVVAKSTDGGASFDPAHARKINTHDCKNCDHEKILAGHAGGADYLYVAYSQATNHFVTTSSDGGATWVEQDVLKADVVAFAEGGAIDAAGNAWFSWGDCQSSSCSGVPAVDYRVSRTTPAGVTTWPSGGTGVMATSVQGPDCPFKACGFAFFGPQSDVAIDGSGWLYVAWQQGADASVRKSPPIIHVSRSTDGGRSWSDLGRIDDKTVSAAYALFPTIVGGPGHSVWLTWFDDRDGNPIDHTNGWNVWLRSSSNGGGSWSGSSRMSAYDPTQSQSAPLGFVFPYGDYMGLTLGSCGSPLLTWGEGHDYAGGPSAPGHIEFRSLC
jgi:hypothetical protein